jgi:hypothetical protein
MEMKSLIRNILLAILVLFPVATHAASLGFSPSIASKNVGQIFSVIVYVSSPDKAMNAVSGTMSFPTDKLEVVGVSKANSVLNLWVEEPSFSNNSGTVNFEGIAFNPGYTGYQGTIISVNFKVKSIGKADLSFTSGSVLANDGSGSNILDSMGRASFTFSQGAEAPIVPPTALAVPQTSNSFIKSSTHPDQSKWYSNNTPEFSWTLPSGALEVKTGISQSSNALPTVSYSPAVNQRKLTALSDGTYYFVLQIRTKEGWSSVYRYRVNIDVTPPNKFAITFPHGTVGWEPQPVILFNTSDGQSGISKYDVRVDSGGPAKSLASADSNPYPLSPQYPGKHTVTVIAVDEAGNPRSATEDFEIEAIEAPKITHYSPELEAGDLVKVRGTTYPNSDVIVVFREGDTVVTEEYTRSNTLGDWAVVATKRFAPGDYSATARVTDPRGAQSNETEPVNISVKSNQIAHLAEILISYLSLAIILILVIGAISVTASYTWHKSRSVMSKLKKETREADRVIEKSFKLLRKDLNDHALKLKNLKRKLTKEELDFLEQFDEELTQAEDIISKEVDDISNS